ncbi:hypothetical protein PtB15_2B294 [Puccinia triticina]|nr:hypothetical protein PtB15_2B294 [Puccinia triticina]
MASKDVLVSSQKQPNQWGYKWEEGFIGCYKELSDPPPIRFDKLLQNSKRNHVQAGLLLRAIYLDQPFRTNGSPLHNWLSEFRIGDFNPDHLPQAPLARPRPLPTTSPLTTDLIVLINQHLAPLAQPCHLNQANKIFRLYNQRVIDAQCGVGVANLSLVNAFAQLFKAKRVKYHLVLQASEGYRPIWPAWLPENTQQTGLPTHI